MENRMKNLITKINSGSDLSMNEAEFLFDCMMSGKLEESQIASILMSLKFKGETVDELAALGMILNKYKKKFTKLSDKSIDTCGTGGDGKSTVNISTAVSIILASMGYPVVKHGNSAQTGKLGSSDILSELGIDLHYTSLSPEKFFKKHNYIYMHAPLYHPALGPIGKIRREIMVPTIFNFVGPIINPADPAYQVIGISNRERLQFYADALLKMGKNNITVYSSNDGYDEVSSQSKTECINIKDNSLSSFTIDPSDFFTPFEMPVVKDKSDAKEIFVNGLRGKDRKIADLFSLNTALALKTMGEKDLKQGFIHSQKHIRSGKAYEKLQQMSETTVSRACHVS